PLPISTGGVFTFPAAASTRSSKPPSLLNHKLPPVSTRLPVVGHTPAFRRVGFETLLKAGSIRLRKPLNPPDFVGSTLTAHTPLRPAASPVTGRPKVIVLRCLPVPGSSRETVPSPRFATQTPPAPYAIACGREPTA